MQHYLFRIAGRTATSPDVAVVTNSVVGQRLKSLLQSQIARSDESIRPATANRQKLKSEG